MKTVIYKSSQLNEICELFKKGGVIAFPTDTVYGLGVIFNNEAALNALKKAKGRAENKPIPTMVATHKELESVMTLNNDGQLLMKAFMPGPLTLIGPKRSSVPSFCTNGSNLIGVRISEYPLIQAIIEMLGCPLLVSSANLTGQANTHNTEEVIAQLDGKISAIVEGKALQQSASTIIDISVTPAKLVRQGEIKIDEIEKVLCYNLAKGE